MFDNSTGCAAPIKNNIRKFRTSKGIKQQELADALEIDRTYLSKLENQKYTPGTELMYKVCVFFDAGLGDVFYI